MKGVTLIELMITIALIGILSASAGVTTSRMRQLAVLEVQREQAHLLVDYHAAHLSRGVPADTAVVARLESPLPDVDVTFDSAGRTTTVVVRWRDPLNRSATHALTVFRQGLAP
jgi:prepilin-type N-terminal cleavage/methylation domain-containing protein